MKKAIAALEDFTGMDAKNLDILEINDNDTFFKVGEVDGILYTTTRDHETEHYIHEFSNKARPELIVSFDGRDIRMISGDFRFTDAGIVDNA